MEWHLLIADPHQTRREQLCDLYSASPLVTHIDVATNCTELHDQLENKPTGFFVVHQSLITDITLLPEGHFVIIATELDNDMLIAAYSHDGGYFLDDPLPSAQLLATLDPTGASWLPKYLAQAALPALNEPLTPCQTRVFELWQGGISYSDIGEQLQISKHTVKKHLENARKRLRKQS